jgi:hypothetical protein
VTTTGTLGVGYDKAPRAELLHVLMLPDFDRTDRIGEFYGNPQDKDIRRAVDRCRGGFRIGRRPLWGCSGKGAKVPLCSWAHPGTRAA